MREPKGDPLLLDVFRSNVARDIPTDGVGSGQRWISSQDKAGENNALVRRGRLGRFASFPVLVRLLVPQSLHREELLIRPV